MKKIEPGCRCVVVNNDYGNNGTEVFAIKKMPETFKFDALNFYSLTGSDIWLVNESIKNVSGQSHPFVAAHHLKPIDDDSRDVSSWESVKDVCGWMPEVTV